MRIVLDIGSDGKIHIWKDELLGRLNFAGFFSIIKAREVESIQGLILQISKILEEEHIKIPKFFEIKK